MPNLNPKQTARDQIDKQLRACGWLIHQVIKDKFITQLLLSKKQVLTFHNLKVIFSTPILVRLIWN